MAAVQHPGQPEEVQERDLPLQEKGRNSQLFRRVSGLLDGGPDVGGVREAQAQGTVQRQEIVTRCLSCCTQFWFAYQRMLGQCALGVSQELCLNSGQLCQAAAVVQHPERPDPVEERDLPLQEKG